MSHPEKTSPKTDWDQYYQKPFKTACWSRWLVRKKLLFLFKQHGLSNQKNLCILEAGGGNSCFFRATAAALNPVRYCVLDQHRTALEQLVKRLAGDKQIIQPEIQEENVLLPAGPMLSEQFDLVFSVGLIEHFPEQETVKALQFHLDCTKSGGLVIVFFPTPTILYRLIRKLAEITGFWIFHDERPLSCRELLPILSPRGKVLEQGILYAMGLTQAFIVFRKS